MSFLRIFYPAKLGLKSKGRKMKIIRILLLVITSPIWLAAGLLMVPLGIAALFAGCVQYGFTGRWEGS